MLLDPKSKSMGRTDNQNTVKKAKGEKKEDEGSREGGGDEGWRMV